MLSQDVRLLFFFVVGNLCCSSRFVLFWIGFPYSFGSTTHN